jgi:hypothetical protein
MCFIHNLFYRNLNAVILQYEQVSKPEDVADFMIFCLMEMNMEQHKAFEEGLKNFGEYVYSVKPEEYDPKAFKEIIDSFMPALATHLNDEILTLLALEKYGGDKLMKVWKDLEKKSLDGAIDLVFLLPRCAVVLY